MREIAVIIENRIKNSKVHEQVQRKQRKNKKLVFPKLGKNTILLSESTSNCKERDTQQFKQRENRGSERSDPTRSSS